VPGRADPEEAGVGKSCLLEALREASGKDHIWVAMRCSHFHTASAFHPIIEHLKRVFGGQPEDTAQQHLAKLEVGLGGFRTLPRSESVRVFADLMAVPLPEDGIRAFRWRSSSAMRPSMRSLHG
jgi:hypothetical protein